MSLRVREHSRAEEYLRVGEEGWRGGLERRVGEEGWRGFEEDWKVGEDSKRIGRLERIRSS